MSKLLEVIEVKSLDHDILIFVETLKRYFRTRGESILGFMNASRQDHVKIEFHGLYHYFRRKDKYSKFMDLYKVLRKKYGNHLEIKGYKIILEENYIVVSKELIKFLLSNK